MAEPTGTSLDAGPCPKEVRPSTLSFVTSVFSSLLLLFCFMTGRGWGQGQLFYDGEGLGSRSVVLWWGGAGVMVSFVPM